MQRRLVNANVVAVARDLDPSALAQGWGAWESVIPPHEIASGQLIATPQVLSIETDRFSVLVVPQRVQCAAKTSDAAEQEELLERAPAIIELLPRATYVAVGANLTWVAWPDEEAFGAFVKRLFWVKGSPVYDAFAGDTARCGAYLSKELDGLQLTLEARPVAPELSPVRTECLQLAFNLHRDLERHADVADALTSLVRDWQSLRGQVEAVVGALEEE